MRNMLRSLLVLLVLSSYAVTVSLGDHTRPPFRPRHRLLTRTTTAPPTTTATTVVVQEETTAATVLTPTTPSDEDTKLISEQVLAQQKDQQKALDTLITTVQPSSPVSNAAFAPYQTELQPATAQDIQQFMLLMQSLQGTDLAALFTPQAGPVHHNFVPSGLPPSFYRTASNTDSAAYAGQQANYGGVVQPYSFQIAPFGTPIPYNPPATPNYVFRNGQYEIENVPAVELGSNGFAGETFSNGLKQQLQPDSSLQNPTPNEQSPPPQLGVQYVTSKPKLQFGEKIPRQREGLRLQPLSNRPSKTQPAVEQTQLIPNNNDYALPTPQNSYVVPPQATYPQESSQPGQLLYSQSPQQSISSQPPSSDNTPHAQPLVYLQDPSQQLFYNPIQPQITGRHEQSPSRRPSTTPSSPSLYQNQAAQPAQQIVYRQPLYSAPQAPIFTHQIQQYLQTPVSHQNGAFVHRNLQLPHEAFYGETLTQGYPPLQDGRSTAGPAGQAGKITQTIS